MKDDTNAETKRVASRSPYGERGLKEYRLQGRRSPHRSLPVRGAWIESPGHPRPPPARPRRSPYGERGLKGSTLGFWRSARRRSPYGERGLKVCHGAHSWRGPRSLPVRGAWIERSTRSTARRRWPSRSPYGERGLKVRWIKQYFLGGDGRSPYGERGLKGSLWSLYLRLPWSLPVRGAWIESALLFVALLVSRVAPRTGRVA